MFGISVVPSILLALGKDVSPESPHQLFPQRAFSSGRSYDNYMGEEKVSAPRHHRPAPLLWLPSTSESEAADPAPAYEEEGPFVNEEAHEDDGEGNYEEDFFYDDE